MLTIGVDVGITGAIAFIDGCAQLVSVADLPICVHGKSKWVDPLPLIALVREAKLKDGDMQMPRAFVEATHAMPKLGTVAANSKGMTLGSTLAALQIAGVSIELVTPQKWKAALGLLMPKASDKEKKATSLTRARMLFPSADLDRVKDHGRAEALLIAHWAYRSFAAPAARVVRE